MRVKGNVIFVASHLRQISAATKLGRGNTRAYNHGLGTQP